MSRFHLVRVGAMGQVGRFSAVDATRYPRGARVVLRTPRGLEVGEVLSMPVADEFRVQADGAILRGLTVEDQLLEARLNKNRAEAYDACQQRLLEVDDSAVLMDVEHLFDGETLLFYFLGDPSPQVTAITEELAAAYESKVRFQDFATAVTTGCGPGCGTSEAGGCGSSCSGCAVAGACSTRGAAR